MNPVKRGVDFGVMKKAITFIIGSSKILMRINWRDILKIKRWKILLMIGIPVFIGVVVVAGLEITGSPKFCATCHNMKPYYESWKTSSHNEVNCIKCHIEPGVMPYLKTKASGLVEVAIYLNKTFLPTIYEAEVSDKACLRDGCHSQTKLKQEKIYFKKGISFEHEKHLQDLQGQFKLRCTSCHSQIVQTEHITVAESTCFTCHFKGKELNKGTAKCTLCHDLSKIPEAKAKFNHQAILKTGMDCLSCHRGVVEGKGEVGQEKCLSCHAEPSRLGKINETSLLHLKHISEHKVECFQCHRLIKHGEQKWPL